MRLIWIGFGFIFALAIPALAQNDQKTAPSQKSADDKNVAEVFGGYSYLNTSVLGSRGYNGGSGSFATCRAPPDSHLWGAAGLTSSLRRTWLSGWRKWTTCTQG